MSSPLPQCPVCQSLRFTVALPVTLTVTINVLSFPQGVKDIDAHVFGHVDRHANEAVQQASAETLVTCTECGHGVPLWVLRQEPDPAQAAKSEQRVEITDFHM